MAKALSPRNPKPRFFYGWAIVAAAFVCIAISSGIWYTFQVFFVAFLEEFEAGRAETSLVFSICVVVYSSSSVLVGWLTDRFGPRAVVSLGGLVLALGLVVSSQAHSLPHLYFSYGFLVAFGIALIDVMPAFVAVSNWFVRRRGAAMGTATAGSGLGLFLFLPLSEYLIGLVGWRNAYLALAALTALVVPPIALALYRQRPEDMGLRPDGDSAPPAEQPTSVSPRPTSRRWTVGRAVRTPFFWFLAVGFGFAPIGSSTVLTHQVAFMKDAGLSAGLAAYVGGLTGIGGAVGRVAISALSDRTGRVVAYGLGAGLVIGGILALYLGGLTGQFPLFYGYAAAFGLGYGAPGPLFAAASADVFHGRNFGLVYGLVRIGSGIGGAFGPWLAGYIFDVTGSYAAAFGVAIVAGLAGWACLIAAQRYARRGSPALLGRGQRV
jgi:MFS family permease